MSSYIMPGTDEAVQSRHNAHTQSVNIDLDIDLPELIEGIHDDVVSNIQVLRNQMVTN